ncbi:MAG: tetratricopeptide repeat protein [Bacteroidaceae bacterium]|nr:tetratricopeptide repeat protein [Bacteroidaceae bacterium]
MKMKRLKYLPMLALAVVMSCSQNKIEEQLSAIDNLCMTNPDSALKILDEIDQNRLSDQEMAHYCFVYTKSQDKARIEVMDDSLIRIAYDYYSQHSDEQPYAQTLYYMGKYFANCKLVPEAEDCLLSAIESAKANDEHYTAFLALGKMSNLVCETDAASGLAFANEAYEQYKQIEEPLLPYNDVNVLANLAYCHMYSGNLDSALYYLDRALSIADIQDDHDLKADILTQYVMIYAYFNQFDTAISYAKQVLETADKPSENLLYLLFHCYGSTGQYDEAMSFISKIDFANSNMRYAKYLNLLRYSLFEKDYSLAIEYADSLNKYANRIYNRGNAANGIYMKDNIAKSTELKMAKLQYKLSKYQTMALILVIVILVIAGIAIVRLIRKRVSNRVESFRQQNVKISRDLNKAISDLSELENSNTQLTKEKDGEIGELKSQVDQLQNSIDALQSRLRDNSMLETDIVRKFTKLKQSQNWSKVPDSEDWEDLEAIVKQYKPQFHQLAISNSLSDREMRVCLLQYIGYGTNDCANALDTTEQNITNVKYSVNSKLFNDGSAKTLKSNMMDLERQ